MQTITQKLKPAQNEVHQTQHDQDLTEVPKRARLDREAQMNEAWNDLDSAPRDIAVPSRTA